MLCLRFHEVNFSKNKTKQKKQRKNLSAVLARKNQCSYLPCHSVVCITWALKYWMQFKQTQSIQYVLLRLSLQGLIPKMPHTCLSRLSHLTPHSALSISAQCDLCLSFIFCRSKQLNSGNSPVQALFFWEKSVGGTKKLLLRFSDYMTRSSLSFSPLLLLNPAAVCKFWFFSNTCCLLWYLPLILPTIQVL